MSSRSQRWQFLCVGCACPPQWRGRMDASDRLRRRPSTRKETAMSNERIDQRPMRPRPARVIVKFDQQQRKLLEFLRIEGKFGREDGDIIRNVVLDYLRQ